MATSTSLSAFQQLQHAQSIDSTWKASIFVMKNRIIGNNNTSIIDTTVTNNSNIKSTSHSDLQSIDIVPYLKKPSIETECFYLHQLKYPAGASFCFNGYSGIADAKPLSKYLIKCALASSGTELSVGKSHGPSKNSKRLVHRFHTLYKMISFLM
jgi:hypothetical protein